MRPTQILAAIGVLAGAALLAFFVLRSAPAPVSTGHEESGEEEEIPRGPHGGAFVEDAPFGFEMKVDESGGEPRLRAWPSMDGEPLEPARVDVTVMLDRPDGRTDRFQLVPDGDSLVSKELVGEPHSFVIRIEARADGEEYRFEFPSYEMRVELDEEARVRAGIGLATAGPATIHRSIPLRGRLVPNEDSLAHIMPRFPGIVREVRKRLGDPVSRDEVLAVIESNESLHPYEVRSRTAGTVIVKDITPGEFVPSDQEIFVVADLRTVWADLDVYRQDFVSLALGQRVRIDAGAGAAPVESEIAFLSPVGSLSSQTLLARAVVPNADGLWRPGLFVSADVRTANVAVPVAVSARAVHRLGPFDVVFVRYGDVFQAHPVLLGARDGENVEVVSGIPAGVQYADENAFVLKADVGKAGASHDH